MDKPRPAPMTAETAHDIIAEMLAKTPRNAMRQALALALNVGNLGPEAREVYRAQLERMAAK